MIVPSNREMGSSGKTEKARTLEIGVVEVMARRFVRIPKEKRCLRETRIPEEC